MYTLLPSHDLGAPQTAGPGQPLLKARRILSISSAKRDRRPLRETSSSATNGTPHDATTRAGPHARPEADAGTLMQRCHMCSKAPRMKRDLDGYSDCWRCRRRTCYVCVRVCEMGGSAPPAGLGFARAVGGLGTGSCGGRRVCRACCVEVGEEGKVVCLDCFENMDDCEMGGCA
jgi:hypothetical protein